jgi:hypothetical protein
MVAEGSRLSSKRLSGNRRGWNTRNRCCGYALLLRSGVSDSKRVNRSIGKRNSEHEPAENCRQSRQASREQAGNPGAKRQKEHEQLNGGRGEEVFVPHAALYDQPCRMFRDSSANPAVS